jgi:hypothetical protein
MLERLVAERALTEVVADEGLTPRRARELIASRLGRGPARLRRLRRATSYGPVVRERAISVT